MKTLVPVAVLEFEQDRADVVARFDTTSRVIDRESRELHAKLEALYTRHNSDWGTEEADNRRIADRLGYDAFLRWFDPQVRTIRARLSELQGLRESAKYSLDRHLDALQQTRQFFSYEIGGLDLGLVDERRDEELQTLARRRAVLVDAHQQALRQGESVRVFLAEDERQAASVAARHAAQLVPDSELHRATAHAQSTRDVVETTMKAAAKAEQQIADIDARLDKRRGVIRAQREREIGQRIGPAAFEAADALLEAVRAMTRLRRLRFASQLPQAFWVVDSLNADDPRCEARAFLERIEAAGWIPKEAR